MDIKKFSSYYEYSNDNGKKKLKYKNTIKINDDESSFLLQKNYNKLNDYLNENFEKKRKNKIDMSKVTGNSTNKSNWEIIENDNGNIVNYEEDYYNFNILLNNGFNIMNNENNSDNYLKKQFEDNQITSKKILNNNIVNKYSELGNKYKNDLFSFQSYYKL
tara:strand:- start:548 stop:1030 length:483 start_codon:yes stop_codon:yes gene_type:complete